MKSVKATDASQKHNIKIRELGRVANPGEVFKVTDERYRVLNGNNRFGYVFVTDNTVHQPVSIITNNTVKAPYVHTNKDNVVLSTPKKTEVSNKPPVNHKDAFLGQVVVTDEEPEIILIKPGKKPVRVDRNLNPLEPEESEEVKQEEPVEEKEENNLDSDAKLDTQVVDVAPKKTTTVLRL